jgi:succinate dehydrogenase/fumarate reductase cytochrome b subunit
MIERKYLPAAIALLLAASAGIASAQDFFAARDLFNNIACNIVCVIEYTILAVSAVVSVLSAARYMSSDDPSVRHDMRNNMIYAIAGIFLVFAGIPAVNAIANQMKSPFYCITCSPDSQLFRAVAETFSCKIICLTQYLAGLVLVLVLILAGIRYMLSGDDPAARSHMIGWIKNALIGIVIIILAVPVLNYITEGAGTSLECDCTKGGTSLSYPITGLTGVLVQASNLFMSIKPNY